MSTSAISSSSIFQELQAYAQQRTTDIQQLGKDLTAGNLANAQQDYATLQSLGQSGPSANGNVFGGGAREQDLNAIGQALQSGDLAGAQAAFTQLQSTFQNNSNAAPAGASTPTVSSGALTCNNWVRISPLAMLPMRCRISIRFSPSGKVARPRVERRLATASANRT